MHRAADALAWRLPDPLAPLARLAYNYRWAWMPGGSELFRSDRPAPLAHGRRQPRAAAAGGLDARRSTRAADDAALIGFAASLEEQVRQDLERESRGPVDAEHPVAYFCAEFAVHQSLPIYSGGLGALAGDILKEASDRALPLVGVGLMYRRGYFRQRIDHSGWQQEYWVLTDPERLPAALVTGDDGEPLKVTVPCARRRRHTPRSGGWTSAASRCCCSTPSCPRTTAPTRWITSRLYDGDPDTRLAQYTLLGLGGVAALEALGVEPGVVHLNEGHAAFAALARAHAHGGDFEAAPRRDDLHHPHAGAGRQRHLPRRPGPQHARPLRRRQRLRRDELIRTRPHPPRRRARAVRRHPVRAAHEPRRQRRQPTATARSPREMWQRPRAADRPRHQRRARPDAGSASRCASCSTATSATAGPRAPTTPRPGPALDNASDEELWAVRNEQRARLVDFVRERSTIDRLARGDARHLVKAAETRLRPRRPDASASPAASPPTSGSNLLFRDPERAIGAAHRRPPRAAADLRQGAPEGRRGQAPRAAAVRAQGPRAASPSASSSSRTTTSAPPPASCAAATCGSTSRARRWRPPARRA